MTLQNLYYFVEAAKDLNFSLTADRLFVSQQSISKHVAKLESYYRVRLFVRTPRLALTGEGIWLMREAQRILAIEDGIHRQFHPEDESADTQIVIGCSSTRGAAFLPATLERLWRSCPDVQISRIDCRNSEAQTLLLNHNMHCHVGYMQESHPGIVSKELLQDRMLFVISRKLYKQYFGNDTGLLDQSDSGIEMAAIKDIPFLIGPQKRRETFFSFFNEIVDLSCYNTKIIESSTLDLLMDLCHRGMGATYLSQMALFNYLSRDYHTYRDDFYYFNASHEGKPINMEIGITFRENCEGCPRSFGVFIDAMEQTFRDLAANIAAFKLEQGVICTQNATISSGIGMM